MSRPPLALPEGDYDAWIGQHRLYDPVPLPLDAAMARFAAEFRDATSDEQRQLSASLDADAGYRLLAFARRASVFAMRRRDRGVVLDGLTACAVLRTDGIDERDILVVLAMLRHAAQRVGSSASDVLPAATAGADSEVAAMVERFLRRPAHERDLRDGWGLVEVSAPGGLGLLRWGFRPWMPTLDLTTAGVRIADLVSAGDYQADDPSLAVEMPEIWLSEAGDPSLGAIIGAARGTVCVHGRLRPAVDTGHASQQLTIWIVEAPDEASAARLTGMARHGRQGASLLGVSSGAAFALVVARSFVRGEEAYESTASLAPFEAPLVGILAHI